MSLVEWMAELPSFHLANRELAAIEADRDRLTEECARLKGEIRILSFDREEKERSVSHLSKKVVELQHALEEMQRDAVNGGGE